MTRTHQALRTFFFFFIFHQSTKCTKLKFTFPLIPKALASKVQVRTQVKLSRVPLHRSDAPGKVQRFCRPTSGFSEIISKIDCVT